MRLRCPHHGCTIDVADDMAGARIRCPHCDGLLFADAANADGAFEAPGAAPAESETGVYAGLPPLSVLLAVREGHGPNWQAARAARAMMTADDWKALAAFEESLHAVAALKLAAGCAVPAAVLTLIRLGSTPTSGLAPVDLAGRLAGLVVSLAVFGTCLPVMVAGRDSLRRLRLNSWAGFAAWAALAVAVVFAGNALASARALAGLGDPSGAACSAFLSIPFQLAAAVTAGLAAGRATRALRQLRPAAIHDRLTEALGLLDGAREG